MGPQTLNKFDLILIHIFCVSEAQSVITSHTEAMQTPSTGVSLNTSCHPLSVEDLLPIKQV